MKNEYIEESTKLAYDDVILVPQYSEIWSRKDVKLDSRLGCYMNGGDRAIRFGLPIISSPMDTVTSGKMAKTMDILGGLGIVHRFMTIEEQVEQCKNLRNPAAAIGITGNWQDRVASLFGAGVRIFDIDVAHGHHGMVKKAIKYLRAEYSLVHIMAGAIANADGFNALREWGADSVRVGVGPGSPCKTQIVSGHGYPILSSILECSEAKERNSGPSIIADGGCKNSGDIVKALAAGADFVILGSLLAGTEEAPGEIVDQNERRYKRYRGMASSEAQMAWSGDVSGEEGVATLVPFKGSAKSVIRDLAQGIKSGCSYSGAKDLNELRVKAKFIKRSHAAVLEGQPHILHK